MKQLLALLRGLPGHPTHPPLTDATIGAYTAGTAAAVLGWLGLAEEAMAHAAFVIVVLGLVFSAGTILTGFLDYLTIRRGTPLRRTANFHWITMAVSTALFVLSAILLKGPYDSGDIGAGPAVMTILAWLVLLVGGWIGGSIVFVYGMRVVMNPATPTREALTPKLPIRRRAEPTG